MILITGARGIIGSALVRKCQSEQIEILAVSRAECNLTIMDELTRLTNRVPSSIVHLAAAVPHSAKYPDSDESASQTIAIDRNVCVAAQTWGCPVVYASTCSLYDKSSATVKCEDYSDIGSKDSKYLRAKKLGEKIFTDHGSTILRLPAPIGPGLPRSVVAQSFFETAMSNDEISVWGSGLREQNYVDVDDIAEAFLQAAKVDCRQIINISADQPTTMMELAQTMKEASSKCSIKLNGSPDPQEGQYARYSNIRAAETLGWRPSRSLAQSILRMRFCR